ncbi:MAG: Wzz/FepE/Etk N-terminal domain-containing protein [bacterium]
MPDAQHADSLEHVNLADIFQLLFRHKVKIAVFSLLGVLASLAVFHFAPGAYESETTLLVRYVSDSTVLDRVSSGERVTAMGGGAEHVINSEIAILASRDLVEKVIDAMGVSRFSYYKARMPDRAWITEKVMAAIRIEAPKNSNVIRITFEGPSPAVAQEFLRRLTEAYLQKHIEIHGAAGAYEFLSRQTDQLRSRLADTEEELRKLKYDEGIVSIEDAKKTVSQRTDELTRGLDDLETTLAAAKARADVLRSLLSTTGGSRTSLVFLASEAGDVGPALRSRLFRLQQKEMELLSVYTPDSIPVTSLREQIAETQRLLGGERPMITTNTVVAGEPPSGVVLGSMEEQASFAAIQARIASQKEILKRALAEMRKIDSVETRIVQLQRSKELQEVNYRYFCQSLEHARIDEALNSGRISNISIVQPATLPLKMKLGKLPRNMALVLLLGVISGLGLAILQEYFVDQTLRKPREMLPAFRAPLLMTVPLLKASRRGRRAGPEERRLLSESTGRDQEEDRVESVLRVDLNDYYELLRDRVLAAMGPVTSSPCVLGVTSCVHGSGVSTLAAGLALSLARGGNQRVVLVNRGADALTPQIFGVNSVTGLTELKADAMGNTAVTQLNHFVVPSREMLVTAHSSGSASRYDALLQYLRSSQAGFVIVDLPPVSETSLTLRIGRLLDGAVLVVAAEKVSRHLAGRVKDLMKESDVRLVGTILNKQHQYAPEWICQNF